MATVFAVFGLENTIWNSVKSNYSSFPSNVRSAMRGLAKNFANVPLPNGVTGDVNAIYHNGTVYHIFGGQVDTEQISIIENYFGSNLIKLFASLAQGAGYTSTDGYIGSLPALNEGISQRTNTIPVGWTNIDVSSVEGGGRHIGVLLPVEPFATLPARFSTYAGLTGKVPTIYGFFIHAYSGGVETSWSYFGQYLDYAQSINCTPLLKIDFLDVNTGNWPLWYSSAAILAGTHDAWLTAMCNKFIEFGRPIICSLCHEFNGDWYPWNGTPFTTKTGHATDWGSTAYKNVWQYVIDFARDSGVNNVEWAWCPAISSAVFGQIAAFFPGGDYVDWIGPTLYNNTAQDQLYRVMRSYPQFPYIIAEGGTSASNEVYYPYTYPGDPQWTTDFISELINNRLEIASCWYNWDNDFKLDRTAGQSEAYAAVVSDPLVLEGPWT